MIAFLFYYILIVNPANIQLLLIGFGSNSKQSTGIYTAQLCNTQHIILFDNDLTDQLELLVRLVRYQRLRSVSLANSVIFLELLLAGEDRSVHAAWHWRRKRIFSLVPCGLCHN